MIRNNLAILMSERGIKNSTLSVKTGISKNTISSTAQNDGKMIQLETINKICQVLDITPESFFSFLPFDVEIIPVLNDLKIEIERSDNLDLNSVKINKIDIDLFIKKKKLGNEVEIYSFALSEKEIPFNNLLFDETLFLNFDLKEQSDSFFSFWNELPITFENDIKTNVEVKIIDEVFLSLDYCLREQLTETICSKIMNNLKVEISILAMGIPY